jgi:hypothetical protein
MPDIPCIAKVIAMIVGAVIAFLFVYAEPWPYENNLLFYGYWSLMLFLCGTGIVCAIWAFAIKIFQKF